MIKIALCDDDQALSNKFENLIERYGKIHDIAICCTSFHSPLDLLAQIEKRTQYDVIFMDILMPGENGIDAASEIRSYDSNVKIIFLSSTADFAVQSYTVGAYYYQLKPISEEILYKILDSVILTCNKEKQNSFVIRCKNGISKIDFNNLEYCEIIHRTLFFHLTDGKVLESIGSMEDLCEQLASTNNFFRPHRSYMINLDHVRSMSYKSVIMDCGVEIHLPRGKYSEIKNAFMEHAFNNRNFIF